MGEKAKSRYLKGTVALLGLGALGFLVLSDGEILAGFDPQRIAAWLTSTGRLAPVFFMGMMALTVATPLPSLPLDLAAGAFFGPWLGTLLSATGALGGALISFGLARFLGRGFIERVLSGHINFCTPCSDRLLTSVIFLTRLVPIVSFDLVSYGAGLTKISLKRYCLATFLGMLPLTFVYNYFGSVITVNRKMAVGFGILMVGLFFLLPRWIERYAPESIRRLFRHYDQPAAEDDDGRSVMGNVALLNAGPLPDLDPATDIAAQLRNDMNRLKGEFYDLERGKVDYAAMRASTAYRDYVACTALLREYDLDRLGSREERLAFWINLYNTLVIHGIIELEVRESVKEVPRFFRRIGYRIGGLAFTPDDIEHGILRGNRRPFHSLFRPFSTVDPRRRHLLLPPDPRIHFTLVCASSSCPPINFYAPERIEQQLETAAAGFINGPEVDIVPARNLLHLSPIFRWYGPDFGGRRGIIDTLVRYLDAEEKRDFAQTQGMRARIKWKTYDWRLNR